MTSLRVLHLIGTSNIGGTERFLADLVRRQRDHGITSLICVLDTPGALSGEYARVASGVAHLEVGRNPAATFRSWRATLASFRPDVLVLYGTRANLLGRIASGGLPVLAALRSTVVDDRGSSLSPWLDRVTFGRLSACVSNSQSALGALVARGYPRARLAFIPAGIDSERFARLDRTAARRSFGLGPEALVLLSVANLKPVKNHGLLVHASALLKASGIAHTLWLVGGGPEREHLESLAREHRVLDCVVFVGPEEDPAARYAAADVFLSSSLWEGSPMSVLEAMAAGLPVVATRVGDLPHIVEDGRSGWLVDSQDARSFAHAVATLTDGALRSSMSEAARSRSRGFSAESGALKYAQLFRWAAAGARLPVPFGFRPPEQVLHDTIPSSSR